MTPGRLYRATKSYVSSLLSPLGEIYSRACKIIVITAGAAVFITVAWAAYADWSKQKALEKEKADKESVGIQASIAGIQLWGAYKACARIGINSVDQCAKYEGVLLQEMAAPPLAKLALEAKGKYYELCDRFYTEESCIKLLNRSWYLSQNTGQNSFADD